MNLLLVSVIFILVAIALILLPQLFWDAVSRSLVTIFGQIFLGNAFTTRKNIWNLAIKNKKRRYSTGIPLLLLGIILLVLSILSL